MTTTTPIKKRSSKSSADATATTFGSISVRRRPTSESPAWKPETGKLHIVATLSSDGSIHGQVFPNYGFGNNLRNNDNLVGGVINPQPGPTANDQYLFAAKPVEPGPNTTIGRRHPVT